MSAGKIAKQIQCVATGQKYIPSLPQIMKIDYQSTPEDLGEPYHTQFRLGVRLECNWTGPDNSEAKELMIRRATQQIVEELYGDLYKETFHLMTLLWAESYRPDYDKVLVQLRKLLGMMEAR